MSVFHENEPGVTGKVLPSQEIGRQRVSLK